MKIGIFTSFQDNDRHLRNAKASCEELGVDYRIVDLCSANWLINVKDADDCDGFYASSTAISQELKNIQDERLYFVSELMHKPIYPDYLGLFIHENKRNMAAWLELNEYPHAKTLVFTQREECDDYLSKCQYPIVVKANVGAAASKVRIVKSRTRALRMSHKALFSIQKMERNGIYRTLYKLHGGLVYGAKTRLGNFPRIPDRLNPQKYYFIVQEYIPDVIYEWRILKIGDSYFGHQKLMKGRYASGSGLVGWVDPPKELLMMVKDLCEKGGFPCMDVDIFETKDGQYCINELQAFFGSYANYQMSIDGHHGRYVWRDDNFHFEEGDYNVYGSTKLKIEHFIKLLDQRQ